MNDDDDDYDKSPLMCRHGVENSGAYLPEANLTSSVKQYTHSYQNLQAANTICAIACATHEHATRGTACYTARCGWAIRDNADVLALLSYFRGRAYATKLSPQHMVTTMMPPCLCMSGRCARMYDRPMHRENMWQRIVYRMLGVPNLRVALDEPATCGNASALATELTAKAVLVNSARTV